MHLSFRSLQSVNLNRNCKKITSFFLKMFSLWRILKTANTEFAASKHSISLTLPEATILKEYFRKHNLFLCKMEKRKNIHEYLLKLFNIIECKDETIYRTIPLNIYLRWVNFVWGKCLARSSLKRIKLIPSLRFVCVLPARLKK